MRYAPLAAALSLALAVTSSMGAAGEREASPRAAMLIAEGKAALDAGQPQKAIDAFEAALVVDPAYTGTYLHLAEAARRDGMQGKAIAYYREVLTRDPDNFAAISGEGEALVEKGALEKAKTNLAKLESECGSGCAETQELATAIARGPQPRVLAAENVLPDTQVTQN
uniref:tetratricopeptide repeat protein n=1 Tax=Parerythrobacter lutipelagi TaxID=1964208 RepID=UPI001EFF9C45|nr:tetratricopeptide repeat protein [Parerythrobacter lutipelagi]